jgi:hypothetical protein
VRVGLLLPGGERHPHPDIALDSLAAFVSKAGAKPDLMAIWARGDLKGGWLLQPEILRRLRGEGVEPMIFAESTGKSYEDILRGIYDDELRRLACRASGCYVRWDQEANGTGLRASWQKPNPANELYVEVFQRVHGVMREEANVRLLYSPVGRHRKQAQDMAAYYPGHEHCEAVGFTMFRNSERGSFPPDQCVHPRDTLAAMAPGKPIIWSETGSDFALERGADWLRSFNEVEGIEITMIFDMAIESHDDDWRWKGPMYRAFPGLVPHA